MIVVCRLESICFRIDSGIYLINITVSRYIEFVNIIEHRPEGGGLYQIYQDDLLVAGLSLHGVSEWNHQSGSKPNPNPKLAFGLVRYDRSEVPNRTIPSLCLFVESATSSTTMELHHDPPMSLRSHRDGITVLVPACYLEPIKLRLAS